MKDCVVRAVFAAAVVAGCGSAWAGVTVNDYIKNGLVGHWDGEFNRGVGEQHDSTPGVEWVDLSGKDQTATAVKGNGVFPFWGDNYMNPSNCVDGKSTVASYYTYTPCQELMDAVNAQTGGVTWEYCGKSFYVWGDTSYCGFAGGGRLGARADYRRDTSPLFIRMRSSGETSLGAASNWLKGCVDSVSWGRQKVLTLLQSSAAIGGDKFSSNASFTPGTTATTGGARLGPGEYGGNGDYALYAVRFYSRELSRVEQLYNAAIDRVRYLGEAERTQKFVGTRSDQSVNYGTSSPAYDSTVKVDPGMAQTFSLAGVAAHPFDGEPAYAVNDVTRALYLGADLTKIAGDGSETTEAYDKTVTSIADVTVDKDMFVTWKWRRQYGLKASSGVGGKLVVEGVGGDTASYENWYDASEGATVTVTAVATGDSWAFNGWTGDIEGDPGNPTQTFVMSKGRTIAAEFVRGGKGDGSTYTWTGGSGSWNDAANWGGLGPLEGDHVVIAPDADTEILLAANSPRYLSVTLGTGKGKVTLKLQNWSTALNADVVTVGAKGILKPSASFTDAQESNRVHVVCNDFTLEAGGKIDANGLGYEGRTSNARGYGPGGGRNDRGGAGHGAPGGHGYQAPTSADTQAYGSLERPEEPGSGGGSSGGKANGGGAVFIEATGRVNLYGTVTANGQVGGSSSGSGSGGSVYVLSQVFDGTNLVSATGGYANGSSAGGGGGGRIAIHYDPAAEAAAGLKPTPILRVGSRYFGQSPYPDATSTYWMNFTTESCRADAGTVWLSDASFVDKPFLLSLSGRLYAPGAPDSYHFDELTLPDETKANTTKDGNEILFYDKTIEIDGALMLPKYSHVRFSNCTVRVGSVLVNGGYLDVQGNSTLVVTGDLTIASTGVAQFWSGASNETFGVAHCGQFVDVGGDLKLDDTAILYPRCEGKTGAGPVFRAQNLFVASGAKVNGFTRGYHGLTMTTQYVHGYGPGEGYNRGAAHGGMGGGPTQNTATYGDKKNPTLPGSDCGYTWSSFMGGYGGGIFRIEVARNAVVDGAITMNGQNAYGSEGGGGAGGAVNIRCGGKFAGAGTITANGGTGGSNVSYSGNGGGGRIAISCVHTNDWSGAAEAKAGSSTAAYKFAPTDGTVVWKLCKGLMLLVR